MTKEKDKIDKTMNTKNIIVNNDDDKLYYIYSNINNQDRIYNFDKNGNLIYELDVNALKNQSNIASGNNTLTEEEKKKLLDAIGEAKKQINFIDEQEKLKEEIKGYPEYNEGITKLYKPSDIITRFKTEKNLLRAMFPANDDSSDTRLLLSLIKNKNLDYYNQLINDEIISSDIFPISTLGYDSIINKFITDFISDNNNLPTIKTIIAAVNLPYSEDFFEEYLYDEQSLDILIEDRYSIMKKYYYDLISEHLKNNTMSSEELVQTLRQVEIKTTSPISDTAFENLKEHIDDSKDTSLYTGIKKLDDNDAYIKKGKITSVFAYTGSFKTMFCSNASYNVIKQGANVLYLSLEISKYEMYMNFLSRHSNNFDKKISHTDIKNNILNEEDKNYLYNTIYQDFKDKLKEHLIIFDETDLKSNTYASYSKLFTQADNYFNKKNGHGIDLIVIDHINLLKFDSGEKVQNDYSAVNHWMSYFRKNAINFLDQKRQVAILCACQSSREGYKKAMRNKKGYDLTSIAEGNEIERSSQLVLSIFTDDEHRKNNISQMQILKLRDGKSTSELLDVGIDPKYYMFGIEVNNCSTKNDKYSNIKSNGSMIMNPHCS